MYSPAVHQVFDLPGTASAGMMQFVSRAGTYVEKVINVVKFRKDHSVSGELDKDDLVAAEEVLKALGACVNQIVAKEQEKGFGE